MRFGRPRYWAFALVVALVLLPFAIKGHKQACEGYDQSNTEECNCIGIAEASAAALFDWLEAYEGAVVGLSTLFLAIFTWRLVVTTEKLSDAGDRQISVAEKSAAAAIGAANAANRSADVAEATLVAANRPWLKTSFEFRGSAIKEPDGRWRLTLDVTAKCYGDAPALSVTTWADQMPDEFDGVNLEPIATKYLAPWVLGEAGETVMPGEPTAGRGTWTFKCKETIAELSPVIVFHVLAGVVYRFPFGPRVPRYTLTYFRLVDGRNTNEAAQNPARIPIGSMGITPMRTYTT